MFSCRSQRALFKSIFIYFLRLVVDEIFEFKVALSFDSLKTFLAMGFSIC